MTETKRFHLGDVLSITTGCLVSPDHIGGVYNILNFMTGNNLFTHQLPTAADEAKPYLLDQFPELQEIQPPQTLVGASKDAWIGWLAEQVATYGEWFEVAPIPENARVPHHPFADLERFGFRAADG